MSEVPTRADYDRETAYGKGYLCYMFAEHEGSQIPKGCPYKKGTKAYEEFQRGEEAAVLDAQDSEE